MISTLLRITSEGLRIQFSRPLWNRKAHNLPVPVLLVAPFASGLELLLLLLLLLKLLVVVAEERLLCLLVLLPGEGDDFTL